MIERRRRSILKVISWRTTATVTTMIISYLVTGSLDVAVTIGAAELVMKLAIQYLHERIWNRIKFGLKPMDYQI